MSDKPKAEIERLRAEVADQRTGLVQDLVSRARACHKGEAKPMSDESPTPAEVEQALATVYTAGRTNRYPEWKGPEHVLAAEVESLRGQLERTQHHLDNFMGAAAAETVKVMQANKEIERLRAELAAANLGYQTVTQELAERNAENVELRVECANLQEIALRVKLGQLEVWPDASKTGVGKSLTAVRKENGRLIEEAERLRAENDALRRRKEIERLGTPVEQPPEMHAAMLAEAQRREGHFTQTCPACELKMLTDGWLRCPRCDTKLNPAEQKP